MQVYNQKLSILLFHSLKRTNAKGLAPIWVRLTIDGMEDEISTSVYVHPNDWDSDNKKVKDTHAAHKASNERLLNITTDLGRHFYLVIAQNGIATPQAVFDSYRTPVNVKREKDEKKDNEILSLAVDDLTQRWIAHCYQEERHDNDVILKETKAEQLAMQRAGLQEERNKLLKRAHRIFDDKNWNKTLLLSTDDDLLNFLEQCMTEGRSYNALKKKWGTKRRLQDFLQYRYKLADIPLSALDLRFIEDYVKFNATHFGNNHNTNWKFVQTLKHIVDRAVQHQWCPVNIFTPFEFPYKEPALPKWPRMEEMLSLIDFAFADKDKHLAEIRDIFVYQSFCGPSYSELHRLHPRHLITREKGKIWVDQRRRKTESQETTPLLPICLEILEKYKQHPACKRSGKCLPVPTNKNYNESIRELGKITGLTLLNNSHQARYFFANVVAHTVEKDLRVIGLMMGQRSPRAIYTYIRPHMEEIAQSMDKIEQHWYHEGGPLVQPPLSTVTETDPKVVQMFPKAKAGDQG